MRATVILFVLLSLGSTLSAQSKSPFLAAIQEGWDSIKTNIARSAAAMPAPDYGFRPTPKVRTFGEILGHLANEHYIICSAVRGEANPNTVDFEKTTAKDALVKAINASIAYCDQAHNNLSESQAVGKVKLFDTEHTRFSALTINVTHDSEHYGNLVTYLRLKDIVPPSSQQTP